MHRRRVENGKNESLSFFCEFHEPIHDVAANGEEFEHFKGFDKRNQILTVYFPLV